MDIFVGFPLLLVGLMEFIAIVWVYGESIVWVYGESIVWVYGESIVWCAVSPLCGVR